MILYFAKNFEYYLSLSAVLTSQFGLSQDKNFDKKSLWLQSNGHDLSTENGDKKVQN